MSRDESRTDLGVVKIHDNVISSIAAAAASQIEGVKKIGSAFGSGLLTLIDKKIFTAIKVEKDKNGEITVKVPLVIKYGYNIPEVAAKVQENVRNNLEKMTNISIKDININVQGVEI